ncbi:MAG: PAS-domain containing protein, partial [Sneathiella sp.]
MGESNARKNETDSSVTDQLNMIMAGLDNIDQAMTIFDQDLNLVYANSKLHDLLGLPYEYMVKGTTLESIFRHNAMSGEYGVGDIEEMVSIRLEAARKFEAHVVERQRPNGVFIRVSGQPLAIGGFATIYTDITAQRQHEIKQEMLIAERTRELRHSEERLRLISNEVPAGIAYLDSEFVIQFANTRFARGYGKTPDEMTATPARDLLGEKTFNQARSRFELAIAGQQSDFGMEITLLDGKERYIQTYLHPDFRQDGTARGFYVLSINVTRQRQAEVALAQAQKMEAVGRLSSGIAHDFNNLLTIIMGNLRALYDSIDGENLKTDMIEPALRAAQRGAGLTEQLLAFARRQPLTPKVIELSDSVHSVVKIMRSSLPGDIELLDNLPSGKIYSHLDRSQFESSLLNLLINSRQAITGQGRIEISLTEINGMAQIRVVDNGIGMDEELVKKIFDPFFTTKGDNGGTGLGLSMAQSFVERSKGE